MDYYGAELEADEVMDAVRPSVLGKRAAEPVDGVQ